MSLSVPRKELERLHKHAEEGYPHEVVGILAGSRVDGRITRIQPLENERADSPENRYKVSGLVLMRAEARLEEQGLEVVGYYHSHPDHPAQYSDYDRDHALPNMSYLITSVENGRVVQTQSWRLQEDRSRMNLETIVIEERS